MKQLTPFQQLQLEVASPEQLAFIVEALLPLKDEYRDDLCLSLVAYMRFRIPREFGNRLIQSIYDTAITFR